MSCSSQIEMSRFALGMLAGSLPVPCGITEPVMQRTALVTLNMRELDRLKVIESVVETGLKPGRAAEELG